MAIRLILNEFQKIRVFKKNIIGKFIVTIIKKKTKKTKIRQECNPSLIIIDSLNVFADIILKTLLVRYPSKDIRDALHIIIGGVEPYDKDAKKPIIVFIGEYDPKNPQSVSIASESYFCDIDIQLTKEPTISEQAMSRRRMGIPERYKEREFVGSRKRLEDRYFCRVLKAREQQNQIRRCSYEIAVNKGLRFYETYPGDGQIMLFAENAAQRTEWEAFIMRDISQMYLYPALDFRIFDRSGLQRVFSSLRRFLHIPERTDMYLSSFDTYWVNWHVELWQRFDLISFLSGERKQEEKTKLPCRDPANQELYERFWQIVGKAHRGYTEYIDGINSGASTLEDEVKLKEHVERIVVGITENDTLCKTCQSEKRKCYNKLKNGIRLAYEHMNEEREQCGLLHLIEEKDLRLFGERRSKIINELDPEKQEETRPVHRPYHSRKTGKVFAVPYNANISFVVYRKDLLRKLKNLKKSDKISLESLQKKIESTFLEIEEAVERAPLQTNNISREKVSCVAKELADKFYKEDYIPQTWEEVITLCEFAGDYLERDTKAVKCSPKDKENTKKDVEEKNFKFLIETQTFDTFASTLLEFIWNCGADFRVFHDYELKDGEKIRVKLFRAFYLLHFMFKNGIIPRDSSLEPGLFANRYSPHLKGEDNQRASSDWFFARHWYSTFIDVLTFKQPVEGTHQKFIWEPNSEVELDIMQIPVSLSYYIEQREQREQRDKQLTESEKKKFEPEHFSCWGEWYLGVMKGTENELLAVDLINNLMSSQKICDRAFSCAALPTLKDFYDRFGQAWCFNLPERESRLLPNKTYNDIRRKFFKNAKSRNNIFDYQHSIQELRSVLEYVRMSKEVNSKELLGRIDNVIRRIKLLGKYEILHA